MELYSREENRELYKLSLELLSEEKEDLDTVLKLIRVLIFNSYRYYVKSKPFITDGEYDILYKKLERIEEKYPDLIQANSPIGKVGSDRIEDYIRE